MTRFLLMVLTAFLCCSCGVQFKNTANQNKDYPDLLLGEFKYISADSSGRREWELRAREAKMYQDKNEIYLVNLSVTFFGPSNNIQSYLSANEGFINKSTMMVFAKGKVVILSEQEASLEANQIYWDNNRKLFYTTPDELVTLRRGNTVTRGYKLTADANLKEAVIEDPKTDMR